MRSSSRSVSQARRYQNRVFTYIMSKVGTARSLISDPEAIARIRGSGGFQAIVAVLFAGGLGIFGALSLRAPQPVVLTVLALLAAVGTFFLFAVLARVVRFGQPEDVDRDVFAELLDNLEQAVLVSTVDGLPVFANAAFEQVVGRNVVGDLNSLEAIMTGNALAAAALFRLTRAGERGERLAEDVVVGRDGDGAGTSFYRVSVGPVTSGLPTTGAKYVLWQVQDLTALRSAQLEELRQLNSQLHHYEDIGIGAFSCRKDGAIGYINPQLVEWLHLSNGGRRQLHIGDVVAEDGIGLVQSLFERDDVRRERVDLDLVREDGARWPASLSISQKGDELLVGAVERVSDSQSGIFESAHGRFARFFQAAPFGIALVGADGTIESANGAFGRLLLASGSIRGSHAREVLGRGASKEVREAIEGALQSALAGKANVPHVEIMVGGEGQFSRQIFMTSVGRGRKTRGGVVLYVIDSTEQKALELKYAQSQKLEAVGKLAGGIAHDFNNVLTVIIGFSDLLLGTHRPGDPAYKNISSIKSSANRAARMVKQLLAFSRRQTLQPEILDVGECLSDISVLVKRLLGEQIELDILPGRSVWPVKADRTQLEQVVFNLAANARDAMPTGGRLSIRTSNLTERESRKLEGKGVVRGQYVSIEVVDTGTGMPADVLQQIFEPFFTTKGVGKGTGLGLATVYGIVKQTGGYIFAESELGQGTTFRIYLPRCHQEALDESVAAGGEAPPAAEVGDITGAGQVLIVEDEDGVRTFAVEALKRKGYDVVEACDGVEALEILKERNFAFDIVVSDVKMPEMDGPTLMNEVRKHRPDLKFIFVSGYADDAFAKQLDPGADFSFLPKPYTLAQIAAQVKSRLGR